ncbi:hypothetical protein ELI16_14415 [Rhizobium ruizarguesonis]|uniref:hypothetical protein n=1 Tax=Rhizobium ruizarguesonis TaxID=2081791 RepID=UPI001031F0CC|nr:hypothetical protein [Rhizobium ruizarguesonis]TAW73046.1 hypothetical protein ELI16_14415 [Rhizobium ruizarguesonis]
MYLANFVNYGGERFYVSTDLKAGKTRIERVSNEAFERFILNVLTMPDPLDPRSSKEVSA